MSQMQIARVDAIPLLFAWMQTMDVVGQIDAHWTPHRAWEGLSYGQLTVLFLVFLIHERDHRLAALEPWVLAHHATLTAVTGWTIRREDVTDDRLGRLLGVLGRDPAQMTGMQQALGRHLVRAYALPTTIARMDTTVTGDDVTWEERWLVVQSTAYAQRQQASFDTRLDRVAAQLQRLRPKADERATDVQMRVPTLLERHHATDYFTVTVTETPTVRRTSGTRGRPRATTPVVEETTYLVQVTVERNADALADARMLLGWRVYVTNTAQDDLSLVQAMGVYREEWTVERNYHRWKRGGLPALPLYLQLEWRIRGLMLLLLIALQVLTLLEWEARRSLAEAKETIAGLAPGNPKRATARPTAERMLSAFPNLHLHLQRVGDQWVGTVVETLNPVQQRILHLLKLSPTLYTFSATIPAESPAPSGECQKWRNGSNTRER